ncbi:MAG TPA: glucan biosynthesis protein G [Gammaproteobacteria bacterium]
MTFLKAAVCVFLCLGASLRTHAQEDRPATPFDREVLIAEAKRLSEREYVQPRLPAEYVRSIGYDEYRAIRFQTAASIWRGQNRNFTLDLFHPGYIYDTPVDIFLVVNGYARQVFFTNEIFEYGPAAKDVAPPVQLGYSGFRVRHPINEPGTLDGFLVFQGASYFRAIGRGQVYGLSARGLAIRTARPEGEEFPVFTDFWVERPPEHASEIKIHALLQSDSLTGAYTFTVKPGEETVMDVQAALFPRVDVTAFGVAPLTSMFLYDGTNRTRFDDVRREVHDSNGLRMVNGNGERIWRPLANPRSLQVSAFLGNNPRGFGLLQRKRRFEDYGDSQARYELRPSAWVEPVGDWGAGHVELVEIPSERDIHDNVVAYWQPAEPLRANQRADFAYRLRWGGGPFEQSPMALVTETRTGKAVQSDNRVFTIDFASPEPVPDGLTLDLSSSAGTVTNAHGELVEPTGAYRVSFELDPTGADVVELRLVVKEDGQPWSETWLYRWSR